MANNGIYFMIGAGRGCFPSKLIFNFDCVVHLFSLVVCVFLPLQDIDNAAAKEVAKKERERLKNQEKQRKEQVEKMRSQLNDDAAVGEVRNYTVYALFVLYSQHAAHQNVPWLIFSLIN
jgi:hypothetical protein